MSIFSIEHNAYFWKDNKVHIVDDEQFNGLVLGDFANCYCVDTEFNNPPDRYGMFNIARRWEHVLLKEFPPEFRANLLLLGIT